MRETPSPLIPDSALIKVLLVEDNPGDARLIRESLREASAARFELTHVEQLSDGLKRLGEEAFDVLLLDLGLPDSQGFDTFATARTQAPGVPIVVLTGLQDETQGVRAVQEGAQDYLVKGFEAGDLLGRSLRYAVERNGLRRDLENRVRELTSLNRLFQEHLNQRFALVDAYREVLKGLERLAQETRELAERAGSQPLPELQELPGPDTGAP